MRLLLLALASLVAGAMINDIEELENVNIEPFLQDEEKWQVLFECLMDRAPCPAGDHQKIKSVVPGVMADNCEHCTEAQVMTYERKVLRFSDVYPMDYDELADKYSPKIIDK